MAKIGVCDTTFASNLFNKKVPRKCFTFSGHKIASQFCCDQKCVGSANAHPTVHEVDEWRK